MEGAIAVELNKRYSNEEEPVRRIQDVVRKNSQTLMEGIRHVTVETGGSENFAAVGVPLGCAKVDIAGVR
jgi:hypothetical protein